MLDRDGRVAGGHRAGTVSSRSFDAWVLPRGIDATSWPQQTVETPSGPVRVRSPVPGPAAVDRAVAVLREGQRSLARRPWRSIARAIGDVARRLAQPSDPLRAEALEAMELTTVLSAPMAEAVLDGMARDWHSERLMAAVEAEGLAGALDRLEPGPRGVLLRARGRGLTVHVGAGTVPGVTATSLVRALLVKSAAWVKPGLGDVALPVVLGRALAAGDADIGAALAVTYWPGDQAPPALLASADLVVAYGGNETLSSLRSRLPGTTPVVAYHHRISVGVLAREALADETVVRAVARAAALFDQRGCVSPRLLLVERGGHRTPESWAESLAEANAAMLRELPTGAWSASEASAIHQLRGTAELRAAEREDVRVLGDPGLRWTVVVDPQADAATGCVGRTLLVRPVDDLAQVPDLLAPVGRVIQSLGWAGPRERGEALAEELSAIGVTRVCGFAAQPFPPAWWRHDGQLPLSPLVRWTEVDLAG